MRTKRKLTFSSDTIRAVTQSVSTRSSRSYGCFFQAEDGIRDYKVTGVQTCALPILWQGGMSFHGGFLGVLIGLWFYARKRGRRWLDVTDFVAPLCPLGLAAGRLGNFINGELVGRVTDAPWGMVFPQVDSLPRHPSQLYELGLEGILLFVILWSYASRHRPMGAVSRLFLLGYGTLRFVAEFAREPDNFLGYLSA